MFDAPKGDGSDPKFAGRGVDLLCEAGDFLAQL
jgi:hypothetical protein